MPSTPYRQRLAAARHIVVKLGTQLLSGADGRPDVPYLHEVARQVAQLRQRGVQVTIVASGAIGAGRAHLGLKARPRDVATLQAVAAVGQPQLMRSIREAFEPRGMHVAQLLLTRSDFDDRERYLNTRNCINMLHRLGCVPIVNENDTVAVEEIRFGDNDMLAALLCNALKAQLLVLLTVVDGLLDGSGHRVDLVSDFAHASTLIHRGTSDLGTGGMVTKHAAAGTVAQAGEIAVIANGRQSDVLLKLFAGENVGTVFAPAPRPRKLSGRKRWIGLTTRPAGAIRIDDGAAAAVCHKGKSLLASGIKTVAGRFEQGQVVAVLDAAGREIARGLSNYGAQELELIKGKKSAQFARILGRAAYDEVIHRDNLVVLQA